VVFAATLFQLAALRERGSVPGRPPVDFVPTSLSGVKDHGVATIRAINLKLYEAYE
jgi:hypothetical protein